MTVQRYVYDDFPAEDHRLAVCDWLDFHGIDGCDVPVPGWIEVDTDNNCIRYLGYVRDADGQIQVNESRDGALTDVFVEQGEGPPLPFPTWKASEEAA